MAEHDWVTTDAADPEAEQVCRRCGARKDGILSLFKSKSGGPWTAAQPACTASTVSWSEITVTKGAEVDLEPPHEGGDDEARDSARMVLKQLGGRVKAVRLLSGRGVGGWYEGSVPKVVPEAAFADPPSRRGGGAHAGLLHGFFPRAPHRAYETLHDFRAHWLAPFIDELRKAGLTVVEDHRS